MRQIFEKKFYRDHDGKEYEVIHHFEIAYPGWECDSDGYVIDYYGTPRLVLSDHGQFDIKPNEEFDDDYYDGDCREGYDKRSADTRRRDLHQLFDILYTYHVLIRQTNEAIDLLLKNNTGEEE